METKHKQEVYKAEKKAFEQKKILAISEILINAGIAAIKQLTITPLPAGFPFLAALSTLTGVQIADVTAQQPPQNFADGGPVNNLDKKYLTDGYVSDGNGSYISGPGTSTSDSIPAMLSDGEFVLNAKAYAMAGGRGGIIDQINDMGRRLATGGPAMIDNIITSSSQAGTISPVAQAPILDMSRVESKMDTLIAVNSRTTKSFVIAREMSDAIDINAVIERKSTLEYM